MLKLYISCVIVFQKKRGGHIKRGINWQLFNDEKLLIEINNTTCFFENNIIVYEESLGIKNTINLNNNIYERETEEFLFKINFNNNTMYYLLKEKNYELKDIKISSQIIINDKITLIYKLDDETKKIVVDFI